MQRVQGIYYAVDTLFARIVHSPECREFAASRHATIIIMRDATALDWGWVPSELRRLAVFVRVFGNKFENYMFFAKRRA
jgi:hypothetical protein